MINEYTDCTEFMRLISDMKIKPSAVKTYLKRHGIVFTASNPSVFAEQVYTILLGSTEMNKITEMIVSDGNYEKSVLVNASLKDSCTEDVIDFFADEFNKLRSSSFFGYTLEQPIKSEDSLWVQFSYRRKLPGKNKLIEEETRYLKLNVRKTSKSTAVIDIRQQSSIDTQKALELLKKLTDGQEDNDLLIKHVNLNILTDKNKVSFFDNLSSYSFPNWSLKTVTGITVKKASSDDEDEDESETELQDGEELSTGTLAGISQAVLNGNGLRNNEFVQNSINQGFFISSMKYRYSCKHEAGEFIVAISCKGQDLRVDIEKSYCDEDGKLYIQPFPRDQQDEIIRDFQSAANRVFYELQQNQAKAQKNDQNSNAADTVI